MSQELHHLKPNPPALRVLDAGMGDGTVLTRTMRAMHNMFPTIPFLIVGKEISLEDVRLSIEKIVDRFHEHSHTVFVATNLYYYEVAGLVPRNSPPADFNWQEIELEGSTTHEFDAQISDQLQPILSAGWRTRTSEKTGNPLYVKPSVVVIYRKDHRFALNVLKSEMKSERRNLRYFPYTDSRSLFRYHLHTLSSEISSNIGTSTLLAAWNAAVYVAQIEDVKLMKALRKGGPAFDDGSPAKQRRPTRVNAADRRFERPNLLYLGHFACGKDAIEGKIGVQNGLFVAHQIGPPLFAQAYAVV